MTGGGGAVPGGAVPGGGVQGIGTDAVDVDRFRAVLGRQPRLADRLFTVEERDRAGLRADPVPTLAARFAAKEAVMKALGVGIGAVDWHDVTVDAVPSGAPELRVTGRAARLAAGAGIARWHVSLTHTTTVAIAMVVAEGAAVVAAVAGDGSAARHARLAAPAGSEPVPGTEVSCSQS